MLTVGDLFSGIGGFSLGLERAGMRTAWFAEVDPYASAVLRKHWPDVPNHGDVRSIRAGIVERVDVLCGGFPCQDISNAGKRAGIDGERSGLWGEFARIIGELRPQFVIVENVAALLGRGIERVLGDLAALGFDAEWHCIPASAVGAPHRRDRVWIVAYAASAHAWRRPGQPEGAEPCQRLASQFLPDARCNCGADTAGSHNGARDVSDADGCEQGRRQLAQRLEDQRNADAAGHGAQGNVADADGRRCEVERLAQHAEQQSACGCVADGCGAGRRGNGALVADARGNRREVGHAEYSEPDRQGQTDSALPCSANVADAGALGQQERSGFARVVRESSIHDARARVERNGWWTTEPDVGRVAHGVPSRVDRLRCLGNAIVPQIAEVIGRAIVSAAHVCTWPACGCADGFCQAWPE